MFFLERSIAGLSSAGQQLLWLGAFLLPLSSASPYAFTVHCATCSYARTLAGQQTAYRRPADRPSQRSPEDQQELKSAVSQSQRSSEMQQALQDAPPLVDQEQEPCWAACAEAWQEAASLVQVSLALGLQVGSPEKRQLARGTPSEGALKQEEEAAPALAHSSMAVNHQQPSAMDSPSLS